MRSAAVKHKDSRTCISRKSDQTPRQYLACSFTGVAIMQFVLSAELRPRCR